MSSPSETLARPCSPFSVQEFGHLVALALDDRFSESLLQFSFDPDPASTSPPSSTPPSSPRSPLSWLSNMTHSVRHSHWSPSTGRRRQFIDKLKRRASAAAYALRPAVSPLVMTPTPQPITTTLSPYQTPAASISRHSSFFEDSDSDEEDPFTPYIPIASQRERGGTAAKLEQDLKPSHTPLSIFSRPSSSITRPTAASPPPSPRSVRSMSSASSASTATEHSSPATPTTPRLNDVPSTPRSSDSHRWSLCTDDDSAHSHSYSYTYTQHPFAQQHLDDPFAKGSVQVVRRSQQRQEQHRSLPASPSPSSSSTRSRSTRRRTSPPRPPPSCPLPQPPCGADPDTSSEDSHAPSNTEWTLHLGVGASLSIKQKHSSAPVAPERRKPDWTLFLPLDVNYPGNARRASPSLNSPTVPDTPSSYASSVLSAATTATTASSMTSSSALSTPMLYSCFPSPPSSIPLPIGPSSLPHSRINVYTRRPALSAPSPFTPPSYLPLSSTISFPTPPQLPSRSTTTALFETATGSTRLVHVRRPAITLSHAQSHFSLPHTGKGLEAVPGREPMAVYDYDYPTRPPRSSDSTCSTSSVASTATIGPGLAQRIAMLRAGVHVLERKMAGSYRVESEEGDALVGREDNDDDKDDDGLDPDTEADSIYYSARSSFSL